MSDRILISTPITAEALRLWRQIELTAFSGPIPELSSIEIAKSLALSEEQIIAALSELSAIAVVRELADDEIECIAAGRTLDGGWLSLIVGTGRSLYIRVERRDSIRLRWGARCELLRRHLARPHDHEAVKVLNGLSVEPDVLDEATRYKITEADWSLHGNMSLDYFARACQPSDRVSRRTRITTLAVLLRIAYGESRPSERADLEIELATLAALLSQLSGTDDRIDGAKREPIAKEIQYDVWRRDGGKCVQCGSQVNLEFDHIIPFSKGGSNTVRNIQLLCEVCNRSKSNTI